VLAAVVTRCTIAAWLAATAGVRLVVAGSGPDLRRLKRIAGRSVDFVESPTDEELRELYRTATALLFPGVEDFGMTLVEAQACGTPVIARRAGGAKEAVRDGLTGVLYGDGSADGLARAIRSFDPADYSLSAMRRHVCTFDGLGFDDAFRAVVEDAMTAGRLPSRAAGTPTGRLLRGEASPLGSVVVG
jgi:glycosyltransferase involved in cell wall biosynthesis